MTMSEIRLERDGDVAIVRIVNAARMNPLTVTMQAELRESLAVLRADPSVRALLLTGEGKAFCAGVDLSGMRSANASDAGDHDGRTLGQRTADIMHEQSNRLVQELRELPLPVVCALNGAAVGGGMGLALTADVVIAARSAYFYLPSLPRLGIVPDLGATWFMSRLVSRARMTGLMLLGDRLSAEQAERWGLVWACVDDEALLTEALAVARRLAAQPVHAVLESRRAQDAADRHSLAEQLCYEAERQRELIDRPEFAEGVRAFIERREPDFKARSA
ncbi:Enoyl-CoA hydratase [Burkholderia singularis]|uniref:Enoyl-CoA hydratase n=2 Tax=Burkholderia singularis TaxID=1503053 RepID=A0A238H4N0_9BURK|nr:enoyl-CoA hydratase-related protein [Burkholderia singularis]SMG00226.1 Enoyl-CoA hydratase [Burkholderia singularis]